MTPVEVLLAFAGHPDRIITGGRSDPPNPMRQQLWAGKFLYREGEARHGVFRIEKGAIAVYQRLVGRPTGKMAIAVPGDCVGLGCLDHYTENARTISECIVTRLRRDEFVALADSDVRLKQLQADAIEREFEGRKALLTAHGHSTPLECVAAFLVAVSRQNVHEGRDPTIVSDSLESGTAASLLNLDIDTLARCLVELEYMALIEPGPDGSIRLRSIDLLELVADGGEVKSQQVPSPENLNSNEAAISHAA